MKAFLSHSSKDKALVTRVYDSLCEQAAWIDSAEIEWGDLFLERISIGLNEATEFLLFWSENAANSQWVRLELHMAFIRMLEEEAIRLRVIKLDDTDLPIYLRPYHFIDVSNEDDPVSQIITAVSKIDEESGRVFRRRFLNRNSELSRMEAAIDDPDTYVVVLNGFAGIGKQSLAKEGLRRFFQGYQVIAIDIGEGTGLTEFALYLNAHARGEELEEGLGNDELRREILISLEYLARSERFLLLTNVQHWLDEDRVPLEPLSTILEALARVPGYRIRPCLMTSTRRLSHQTVRNHGVTAIWLEGMPDESISVLLRLWYELNTGSYLATEQADLVATQLYGHPIAAKLAAGMVAQYGVEYLERYPTEYVTLRRDLTKELLLDMELKESTSNIMKALAAADSPLPTSVIYSVLQIDETDFHAAISQATSAGLIGLSDGQLHIHPLISEHFWNLLDRDDYGSYLTKLATEVHSYANQAGVGSAEFSLFVPVIFRLYAAAGDWESARSIRRDLQGELERAAVFHYRRRNYNLAWDYIQYALQGYNPNWRMRLYEARILIRRERWVEADAALEELLSERPDDRSVLHAKGWRLLRQQRFEEAINVFSQVIAREEHASSLRDAAECLHRLDRNEEALEFLSRAKQVESDNAYILDLEARILEERGDFDAAYEAAYVAMLRDPNNWAFHHRLGQIRARQRRAEEAVSHLRQAIELDKNQFTPIHALAAALLDLGEIQKAEDLLPSLGENASTRNNTHLLEHLKARVLIEKGEIEEGCKVLRREIRRNNNLVPNLGLLANAKIRESAQLRIEFPALSDVALKEAEDSTQSGLHIEPSNQFLLESLSRIEAIRAARQN